MIETVRWLFAFQLLFLSAASAEERAPSTLTPDELVAETVQAIEELSALEAGVVGDREAFRRSEEDLARTIEELKKPLPERPLSLQEMNRTDTEYIRAQFQVAETFRKAWEQRQSSYQRSAETLKLLNSLSAGLRKTQETLLDHLAARRPLLIEAQRRIDRRDLKVASFKLEEGSRSITEWIAKSAELVGQRDQLLGEVDDMVRRLEAMRQAFEALPGDDPETSRSARRIAINLSTIAEATVVADEQRAQLKKVPVEAVPSELGRAIEEWKARRDALDPSVTKYTAQRDALRALVSERQSLEVPRREDVPEGDSLPEVNDARRDATLSARLVAYYQKVTALLKKAAVQRQDLLKVIEEVSQKHAAFTRQTARVFATFRHANELAGNGTLTDWSAPADISRELVWDVWRRFQIAELERVELAEQLRSELAEPQAIEASRAKLEEEHENQRRAEARLETELSYAESVAQMEDQSDERLLAILQPEGEIAKALAQIDGEISRIGSELAALKEQCSAAVRGVHNVENPHSRAVLRERGGELVALKESFEKLAEGDLPADRAESLAPLKESPRVIFPEELHDGTKESITQLADKEAEHIGREQQFTRLFLDFFLNLEANLAQLRGWVTEHRRLDGEYERQAEAKIREEKRRYAAARQIRRRVSAGLLDGTNLPQELSDWLGREAIRKATDDLRSTRRANSLFYDRVAFEVERLEKVASGAKWMRIRSAAADARASLVGQPVSLLSEALTPIDELDELDRKNLDYRARTAESEETPLQEHLWGRFTDDAERQHYEDVRHTYYLELANVDRVRQNLRGARDAYEQMVEVCVQEHKDLQPSKGLLRDLLAFRLFDYQAARYAVAVALHPDRRARIEEAFRKEYGRDLPYRLNFEEGQVGLAAEVLFEAECRLIAERSIGEDAKLFVSKTGLEQETGWYKSQIARVDSLIEIEKGRAEDLQEKIASLGKTYGHVLNVNAIRGIGITLSIPVVAFLIVRLLRRLSRRFEDRIALKESEDISDRQRRMQTISRTSTAAIRVLVWTIAIVYVFAQLGLDVTPIVASASVLGLAVAFGAQALIKDFFYGFFILIENQFTMGDVVTLGNITGTVERISLRITVVRDLQGVVHYIPNGSIGQVSNKTQGWSRVVMEVSVAYKEDPDNASRILGDVLLEMAGDEAWRDDIIEDPVVAGVENLTERSVEIRIMIKTRPGKQWGVAREARRRIKKRFDELGIEIPFPHRVVHHVYQGAEAVDEDAPHRDPPQLPRRVKPEEN